MKAVILDDNNDVRVKEVKPSNLKDGELQVQLSICGVCGTDIEKMMGHVMTSRVLGHELVGRITRTGGVSTEFSPGDRVFVHHHVACYSCHYCTRGSYTMCKEFARTNLDPGGFSELIRVPAENVERGGVLKLPSTVDDEDAVFIEPAACCLRAQLRAGIVEGENVAVLGAGPAGLIHLMLLKCMGVSLMLAFDVNPFRLAAAERLGALTPQTTGEDPVSFTRTQTNNRGADTVIVATSAAGAINQGLSMVRKGGTVLVFGAPPLDERLTLSPGTLFLRETSVIPSYSATESETRVILRMLSEKRITFKELITNRLRLHEFPNEIASYSKRKDCLKVVVLP